MGAKVPAQYPNWDGSSADRIAPVEFIDREPTRADYDQITAEVIEIEKTLNASNIALTVIPWTDITPANSWVNKASNAKLGFKQWGTLVSLRGVITPGTKTNATSVGIIPAGSRPLNPHTFPVVAAGGDTNDTSVVSVLVGTDGTLKIYGVSASTSLDLSSIQFHTDA